MSKYTGKFDLTTYVSIKLARNPDIWWATNCFSSPGDTGALKKLKAMEAQGLISSKKKGNSRWWRWNDTDETAIVRALMLALGATNVVRPNNHVS